MGKDSKSEYGATTTEAGGLLKIAVYTSKKKNRMCEYHGCTSAADGRGSATRQATSHCFIVGANRELDVCDECLAVVRENGGFAAASGADVLLLGDEDELKFDLKSLKVRLIVLSGQIGELQAKVNKGDKGSVPFLKGLQEQNEELKKSITELEKTLGVGGQRVLQAIINDQVKVVKLTGKGVRCDRCNDRTAVATVTFHGDTKRCCSTCTAEIQQEAQFAQALRRQSSGRDDAADIGKGAQRTRLQRALSDPDVLSARSEARAAAARAERDNAMAARGHVRRFETVANFQSAGYGRNRSSTLETAPNASDGKPNPASAAGPINGASNYGKIGFVVPPLDLNYGTVKIYDSSSVREPCEKCGDRPFEAKVTTSKGVRKWCKPCVIAAKQRKQKEKALREAAAPIQEEESSSAPAVSTKDA